MSQDKFGFLFWLRWIVGFAGALILSAVLVSSMVMWSYVYRERIGTPGASWNRDWAKAVMATWLVFLLPFLAWMYRRADQIFRHATERQQARGPKFRTVHVAQIKRKLPAVLTRKLQTMTPTLDRGHLLTAQLKDGRRIPHIFVMNGSEILGVYDHAAFDFEVLDIETIELMDPAALPAYDESKWLRLDSGV